MGINQSDCLSYLHVISPPSNLRMQNKALFTALCVALFAAAIAVPVNEDLQTKEEFGAVKNAIGSAANKFSSWLKGKECQLRSCSACETKTKRSWGRRRCPRCRDRRGQEGCRYTRRDRRREGQDQGPP